MLRVFVTLLGLVFATLSATAASRPVVVIPGVMGSKLCDAAGRVVWGDKASYTAGRIQALRLPAGANLRSCGLIETVSIVPSFWSQDVYSGLLSLLHEKISVPSDKLLIFDYDWRLSNFENAKHLEAFVADKVPSGQFDIVAHSMGGLVARLYMQRDAAASRVRHIVFLGTPHRGSASVFQRLREGFEHWPNVLSGGLPKIQEAILSFPSMYQILPTYENACGFSNKQSTPPSIEYVDCLALSTWENFTWLPSGFLSGVRRDELARHLAEARAQKDALKRPVFSGGTGRASYIANGFQETWSRVLFDRATGGFDGPITEVGDGTVLLFSATDGDPTRVQVSEREHQAVFLGRSPALVLEAFFGEREYHAATVAFEQVAITSTGEKVEIGKVRFGLTPETVVAGSQVDFSLVFQHAQPFDIGKAVVDVSLSGHTDVRISVDRSAISDVVTQFTGSFRAPDEPGAYSFVVRINGLEPLSRAFAVLQP